MENEIFESIYLHTFELYLASSTEHQSIKNFIHTTLPDILASIGAGEPTLNVMGVGSGSGELDLEILKVLHEKHPDAKVENEVVDPSSAMLNKYRESISKMPSFDYVTFRWNKMTAVEFENEWKKRSSDKKMHFINMIQMLYYVKDPEATLSFYRNLLKKDGKILVIVNTEESAWARLFYAYEDELRQDGNSMCLTTGELKSFLNSKKIPYQSYKLPVLLDITKCFTPEDKKGEQILDILTEVVNFSKTAPPELKDGVVEFLKHPDNSQEVNGRILFDCSLEALLIDA
ncbi:histamine N-methyltransferase-like [Clarias gariepinus]|uniref:histamine N-methyltransferase-like n=1 Tax=Clarias gariepinus TaxID=13013 RepID=UPI00234CB56E|nr:histamine N-methyltransferase-like [Clarias gariepinus]